MNVEISNTKPSPFKLIKVEPVKSIEIYNRFVNWVIGEFDLYLKNVESKELKVYFPNGWFSIGGFSNEYEQVIVEIEVKNKSKVACEKMMKQLEHIYNHVMRFTEKNVNQLLVNG